MMKKAPAKMKKKSMAKMAKKSPAKNFGYAAKKAANSGAKKFTYAGKTYPTQAKKDAAVKMMKKKSAVTMKKKSSAKMMKKKQGNTLYQVLTKIKPMTYLYYKTSTATYNQKPNEKTIEEWKHLADKKNWSEDAWQDVTRRETIEGAEAAIDGSIDHFDKKLEATKGPKVIKTFK